MRRLFLLALLLAPLCGLADSIYRSTDAQGNVVFTDTPPANGSSADRIEVQRTNTTVPVQPLVQPAPTGTPNGAAKPLYVVAISEPANETSIARGPGNFSVRANVTPALKKYEGLQLFMDGTPWGTPQRDTLWDLTNVFRGQHDITVGVVDNAGKSLAISAPVRVFVHRPSTNFNQPTAKPKPPRPTPHK